MGTKVQNLPGYYSMRDLNEESSSCGWPLFYGDKTLANGQYYHNYMSSATADACSAYDKDAVKQTMLEHEAVFKNQVFELHRLYRVQRDLMDEARMKELHRNQIPVETSFSTGPFASQITSEDGKKWHIPGFPIGSPTCARTSISGIEGTRTPLGSNKGTSNQASLFPSPNGSSSKDVEVLESRPSKVRRRMFDLHLPADEYIDTEESEKLSDEKISGTTILLPERSCKQGKGIDVKPFFGNGGKTGSQEDTSRPEQFLRSRNGLADLNEPVQEEETYDATYVPFPNHNPYQDATECSDVSAKQKSRLFGLSSEDLLNSRHGTDSWARNNGYVDNNGSGKGWISSVLEAGQAKSNLKPIPQVLGQEHSLFSSQTMKNSLSRAHEPTYDSQTNQSKADFWRGKTVSSLDTSEGNREHSTNKHPESAVASSHRPGFFAIAPSTDLSKSWSHSTSLEMASSSLSQKLVSVQAAPSLSASGALSRSSQSHQNNGILGDSWPKNVNSKLNPGFHHELPVQNGFYSGSSTGSKGLSVNISSISYDYLNHNSDCKRIPEHFNNGSAKCYKSSNSNCNDMTSRKDINLNVILSNGSSNNLVTQSSGLGIRNGEQKHEEQLAVLPWLKAKSTCKNEAQIAGRSLTAGESSFFQVASLSNKDDTSKGSSGKFLHNVTSGLCSKNIETRRTEISEGSSKRKILGVPIFDMPHISPKESYSLTSPSLSVHNPSGIELVENKRKNWVLDINLPCDVDVIELDDEAVTEIIVNKEESPTIEANSRNLIDLNLSMCEDEAFLTTTPTANIETKAEIDLEAPAVPETEEDVIPEEKQLETPLVLPPGPQDTGKQQHDEVIKSAAEAIVVMSSLCCNQVDDVISSPSESPMADPLGWFVDVVSSCVDLERKIDNSRGKNGEDNAVSSTEEMDYFEAMTLKLPEMKEEDHMPQPIVPEDFKVEETGTTSLPARARKGSARRGRQRRDFQRDILPGLSSLSRHEVTEDLQIFGGLMRATGHSWSGLTRRSSSRNGCGRGRRRLQVAPSPPPPPVATIETSTPLIQQLNAIEVGLEDRSLTGWGKTTRRPRRQRCPAGNPPSIRLI